MKIQTGRMGCAFEPPNHPTYSWEVLDGKSGYMSLDYARTCAYVPQTIKDEIEKIFAAWSPLPLDSSETQAWIKTVMTHYRYCYRGPADLGERAWHSVNIVIDKTESLPDSEHCGVHHI